MPTTPNPCTDRPAPWQELALTAHAVRIAESHRKLTGRPLLEHAGDTHSALADALWRAPFALLAHGTEPDPCFNYGNARALALFECTWAELTVLPSRLSAPATDQAARAALMAEVARQGFLDGYRGVRVTRKGRLFRIESATIWNVVDERGAHCGQAACLHAWTTPVAPSAP